MVLSCTALVTRENDSLATDRVNAFAFSKNPIITSTRISIDDGSPSEGCVGWDLGFFDFFDVSSPENIWEAASRMVWIWDYRCGIKEWLVEQYGPRGFRGCQPHHSEIEAETTRELIQTLLRSPAHHHKSSKPKKSQIP